MKRKKRVNPEATKANRRYYLHQLIKGAGFLYDPYQHVVYVHHRYNNNNKFVTELKKDYGYNVQLEIR